MEFDPGIAFRTTLAMVDAGIEIMRGQLKRKHPTASREELQVLLNAWLADRRGAPFGDGPGTPRPIRPATT